MLQTLTDHLEIVWGALLAAAIVVLLTPAVGGMARLLGAVDRVLRAAKRPDMHDVVARALDVDGAMSVVRAVLAMRARARWRDIIANDAEPWQVLSVLLALLEMAKAGELRVTQSRPFASVEITSDTPGEAA